MGSSPRGKLIYGYDLGGSENGPLIAEVDEDGNWQAPWAITVAQDPGRIREDPDPFDHIVDTLRAAGMDAGDEYDTCPLRLIGHGHLEYGWAHALVAYQSAEAEWSETVAVDIPALEIMRQAQGWDELLTQAVNILGITPIEIANTDNRWDSDAPRVPVPPRWMVVAKYI